MQRAEQPEANGLAESKGQRQVPSGPLEPTSPRQLSLGVGAPYHCPITHELMVDPVVLEETQQAYERLAIEEWFRRGRQTCPATGTRVKSKRLRCHAELREAIRSYAERTGQTLPAYYQRQIVEPPPLPPQLDLRALRDARSEQALHLAVYSGQESIPELVVMLGRTFPPGVQEWAAQMLSQPGEDMNMEAERLKKVTACGAIKPLVRLLGPANSPDVQDAAMNALCFLLQDPESQATAAQAGAVPFICSLLETRPASAYLTLTLLTSISSLNIQVQEAFAQANCIPIIHKYLRRPEVRTEALRALSTLAYGSCEPRADELLPGSYLALAYYLGRQDPSLAPQLTAFAVTVANYLLLEQAVSQAPKQTVCSDRVMEEMFDSRLLAKLVGLLRSDQPSQVAELAAETLRNLLQPSSTTREAYEASREPFRGLEAASTSAATAVIVTERADLADRKASGRSCGTSPTYENRPEPITRPTPRTRRLSTVEDAIRIRTTVTIIKILGCIPKLLKQVREHGNYQLKCIALLHSLCRLDPKLVPTYGKEIVMALLQSLGQTEYQSKELLAFVLGFLAFLAADSYERCTTIHKWGGVPLLLGFLRPLYPLSVQNSALGAVSELIQSGGPKVHKALALRGGIHLLVPLLGPSYPRDVQSRAAGCLAMLAMHPNLRPAVAAEGVAARAVQILKEPAPEHLQEALASLLASLTWSQQDEGCLLGIGVGSVSLYVRNSDESLEVPSVYLALTLGDMELERTCSEAIPSLVKLLEVTSTSFVPISAMQALCSIAKAQPATQAVILGSGAVPAMFSLLKDAPADQVQQVAAQALVALSPIPGFSADILKAGADLSGSDKVRFNKTFADLLEGRSRWGGPRGRVLGAPILAALGFLMTAVIGDLVGRGQDGVENRRVLTCPLQERMYVMMEPWVLYAVSSIRVRRR